MYCPPNSQLEFSEKVRFVGCGSFDGDMLPTRASSGSAATPAPPIRLAWISVRRESRSLDFASPSCGAAPSRAGRTVVRSGAGQGGVVSGRRGAVPEAPPSAAPAAAVPPSAVGGAVPRLS